MSYLGHPALFTGNAAHEFSQTGRVALDLRRRLCHGQPLSSLSFSYSAQPPHHVVSYKTHRSTNLYSYSSNELCGAMFTAAGVLTWAAAATLRTSFFGSFGMSIAPLKTAPSSITIRCVETSPITVEDFFSSTRAVAATPP